MNPTPNLGKAIDIFVGENKFARLPIKTKVIEKGDDLEKIIEEFVLPHIAADDLIFMSEKIVAISQGRAFHIDDIKPSWLAKFLVKFVHKSPYGIGLGSPWTMELAIKEAGVCRMLFAAGIAAVTKPFGVKGLFYKVVGKNINAIDGPCDYTIPPYNKYAKLGPAKPNEVCKKLKERFGHEFVIIDANDLGANVLGRSNENISDEFCLKVFRDNPLGQTNEQTPIALVRKLKSNN